MRYHDEEAHAQDIGTAYEQRCVTADMSNVPHSSQCFLRRSWRRGRIIYASRSTMESVHGACVTVS